MKKRENNIILQMFDVQPANAGRLDFEKVDLVRRRTEEARKRNKLPFCPIKNVIPDTLDVRPVIEKEGILKNKNEDREEKIFRDKEAKKEEKLASVLPYYAEKISPEVLETWRFSEFLKEEKKQKNIKDTREVYKKHEVPIYFDDIKNIKKVTAEFAEKKNEHYLGEPSFLSEHDLEKVDYFEKIESSSRIKKRKNVHRKETDEKKEIFSFGDIFFYEKYFKPFSSKKTVFSFASVAIVVFLAISGFNLANKGLKAERSAVENSGKVFASFASAKDRLKNGDFKSAALDFNEAYWELEKISKDINSLGGIVIESSKYVPYLSRLSSGAHLVEATKDLSRIGSLISENMTVFEKIKNSKDSQGEDVSYLKIFNETQSGVSEVSSLLKNVKKNLDSVDVSDIPEDKRNEFIELRKNLPEANRFLDEFVANEKIFTDILGGNGPRKYLFLFQNNQEMRPTGGFIGTYAVLDMFNGQVRNFFVDGIFNPDGQFNDRIVPPSPIQKISANWSLHDSNWFPDFPVSAEKATLFYEKTGGPTVDGVIAITPTVLEKLLEVTGPIEMVDYGVTIDKDNFTEAVQNEVEYNYDKELNQPKKIISDLAPIILDRIFNSNNFSDIAKTMGIFKESLDEKHVLIYSKNWEIEKVLSDKGWSGEVLDTSKDYLSVINTNINGYKTDGVISEEISHEAQIQSDGSIVDTVTVKRRHNGGDATYDFWNKVNADYMRIYVPQGSTLISVSGQTREFNSPPLDYDALGYKRDPQIKMEEDSMVIDEESGTRIYQDAGKTVFANWIYVSPKETVEIKYVYLLPFKIKTNLTSKPADTYSLLVQKQSGSFGSGFHFKLVFPDFYKALWKYPDDFGGEGNSFSVSGDLKADKFIGIALTRK